MSIKVELKRNPKKSNAHFFDGILYSKTIREDHNASSETLKNKINLFKVLKEKSRKITIAYHPEKNTAYYFGSLEIIPEEYDENKGFDFYNISYDDYEKKLKNKEWILRTQYNTLNPIYGALSVFVAQTVGFSFAKALPDSKEGFHAILKDPGNVANIGLQTGYPIVANFIFGMIHYKHSYQNFVKTKGRQPTEEENNALIIDSALLATKGLFASGAWELGLFVGQLIITACHFTPHTAWVPITLILASALFQAIMAVSIQAALDRRKAPAERMSAHDYAKLFLMTFTSGAIYTALSFVPGLPFLATSIFKPIANILGNIGVGLVIGAVNSITSLIISYGGSTVYDKTVKPTSDAIYRFFKTPLTDQSPVRTLTSRGNLAFA